MEGKGKENKMKIVWLVPLLFLVGCASNQVCPTLKYPEITCPMPSKPELQKLDSTKTWAHPDNVTTLLDNLNKQVRYGKDLEGSVKCYQDSLKKVQ